MRKIVEYAATYDTKIAKDFLHWLQSESGYTAEQKKTVLQKAAELFGKIFDKIKELLRDGHLSSVAKDFAQAQADEASRLRRMFLEVLDGMEVNQSTVDSQQSTARVGCCLKL